MKINESGVGTLSNNSPPGLPSLKRSTEKAPQEGGGRTTGGPSLRSSKHFPIFISSTQLVGIVIFGTQGPSTPCAPSSEAAPSSAGMFSLLQALYFICGQAADANHCIPSPDHTGGGGEFIFFPQFPQFSRFLFPSHFCRFIFKVPFFLHMHMPPPLCPSHLNCFNHAFLIFKIAFEP